jgi:pimeloyl-ACP methyl ester carboxylesterase
MPTLALKSSPLLPGQSPVEIFYRDEGAGPTLVLLHGGWGYSLNPFALQQEKLAQRFRVICPDRSGYGRSAHLAHHQELPLDFHYRAARETVDILDSLNLKQVYLWGHSDGAVIAAILGFTAPERVRGLVLEAFHYYRQKPRSREFFETLAARPEALGREMCERFVREFGPQDWRHLITTHARAWLNLALAPDDQADLYHGRLYEISAPVLLIHGALDPRTEPGELETVAVELPRADMQLLEGASHSPHSEQGFSEVVTGIVSEFLTRVELAL